MYLLKLRWVDSEAGEDASEPVKVVRVCHATHVRESGNEPSVTAGAVGVCAWILLANGIQIESKEPTSCKAD